MLPQILNHLQSLKNKTKTMKKLFLSIVTVLITASLFSQAAPGLFKYQAVIRDAAGAVKVSTAAKVDVVILKGAADGDIVLSETHNTTTNAYGLVTLNIGSVDAANFAKINWAMGPYFITIIVNDVEMGTSQLLSVPYALYAEKANVPGVMGPKGDKGDSGEGGGGQVGLSDSILLKGANGKVYALKVDGTGALSVAESSLPTVTDIDGFTYHQIVIGNQVWLKENLRTTKFNDGTPILIADKATWAGLVADTVTPAMGILHDSVYYNWQVANTPNKNPCPAGFRVPSKAEWGVLAAFAGGTLNGDATAWENCASKLKSVAAGGTDDFGFKGELLGARDGGSGGYNLGWGIARWWARGSRNFGGKDKATEVGLWSGNENLSVGAWYWNGGENIRCVKGELVYDADGNDYTTVKIGNQTWLKENLRATKFNDGTPILNAQTNAQWLALIADTTTAAYSFREDTLKNVGAFYNWQAANTPGKNPCPSGFHVPTRDEFNTLANFVGGNYVTDWGGQWQGAGTKLKSVAAGGTDDYGFSAEILGSRDGDGSTYHLDWTIARFWANGPRNYGGMDKATEIGFGLTWNDMGIGTWYYNGGHNIRCVK